MRTRAVMVIAALMCLTLPLFAQEQQLEATIQFSGEKAEAISSFSWGVSQSRLSPGEGGGGAGKAVFTELSFTKPVNQLSSALFLACATGKHFPSVVIQVAKKKGGKDKQAYYEVKLVDLVVSSYRQSGGEGGSTDTTSLTYASAEFTLINP